MSLFETIEVDQTSVQSILSERYSPDLLIEKKIKGSQNHTYEARNLKTDRLIAVRVTPDTDGTNLSRIQNELHFLQYLKDSKQINYICGPVLTSTGESLVAMDGLVVVLFEWAKGEPINFIAYEWPHDYELLFDWGRWFALYHKVSREYSAEHPERVRRFQAWDEIHRGILRNLSIEASDAAVVEDSSQFGVIHGDLNLSNFFYLRNERTLSVFDWDQTQRGWYLWDVAQALVAGVMIAEAGSVIDGSPVPGISPQAIEDHLIRGYESVLGEGSVDRHRLHRMLDLRLAFYERFCRQAEQEGNLPKDMEHFIRYIIAWFDRRNSSSSANNDNQR